MLDAITNVLPASERDRADRSIAATAGALFALVVGGTIALATGRIPFTLDWPMLTLYMSLIPLSIAGFMVSFARKAPRLPMLATLWFLALFTPLMFFSEAFLSHGQFVIGGLALPAKDFVGFRAIVVAAAAGLLFSRIDAHGLVGQATRSIANRVDWHKRHDEAVRRLAMVDRELRDQRAHEESELDAFDRLLAAAAPGDEDEWTLEVEESLEAVTAAA